MVELLKFKHVDEHFYVFEVEAVWLPSDLTSERCDGEVEATLTIDELRCFLLQTHRLLRNAKMTVAWCVPSGPTTAHVNESRLVYNKWNLMKRRADGETLDGEQTEFFWSKSNYITLVCQSLDT